VSQRPVTASAGWAAAGRARASSSAAAGRRRSGEGFGVDGDMGSFLGRFSVRVANDMLVAA
jgi:hypothetical protein